MQEGTFQSVKEKDMHAWQEEQKREEEEAGEGGGGEGG